MSHLLPRGGAGTFVGRDANVVRETVIGTPLRARRPVDLCGHPPSLGSYVRRVRGIPCRPRRHPRCSRKYSTWACSSGPPRAPVFAASFSLKIERRFMRRVDLWVRSRGSGCPVHKKQLLPVLVVLAPPRKKRSQEQHALNGNTSASAASSSCGTIPGTGSKRHSDGSFVVLPPRTLASHEAQKEDLRKPIAGRPRACRDVRCEVPRSTMSAIAPAPKESFFRRRLPHSVCNSARPKAHGFGDTVSCPFYPMAAAEERQGVSVHAPRAPPRARKAFRVQWH